MINRAQEEENLNILVFSEFPMTTQFVADLMRKENIFPQTLDKEKTEDLPQKVLKEGPIATHTFSDEETNKTYKVYEQFKQLNNINEDIKKNCQVVVWAFDFYKVLSKPEKVEKFKENCYKIWKDLHT